jgi:hypothetical protein
LSPGLADAKKPVLKRTGFFAHEAEMPPVRRRSAAEKEVSRRRTTIAPSISMNKKKKISQRNASLL